MAGQIIMRDDKHQLIGDNAGEIIFTGANALTIDSTYSATTHPFGDGQSGSVIFQGGAGGSSATVSIRWAARVNRSSLSMQAAPLIFTATTALLGDAGTYGNLILDGSARLPSIAGSSPMTILNDLET